MCEDVYFYTFDKKSKDVLLVSCLFKRLVWVVTLDLWFKVSIRFRLVMEFRGV